MRAKVVAFAPVLLLVFTLPAAAQFPPGKQGSANMHIMAHLPMGKDKTTSDIELEQELSRPYAYVDRRLQPSGFDIVNLKDPKKAYVMYSWRIENPQLHQGSGSLAPTYLKSRGRYYFFNGFQFAASGPDNDLGAIVFDVTGLPDTSKIKEVARVRVPETPGGFHETFSYKHSSGQSLVFTTASGPFGYVFDIDKVVGGDPGKGIVGRVPVPETPNARSKSWHDFYVGYDPANKRDVFYGAGGGGYYVFDVTNLAEPKLLTTVTGTAGVDWGHTFTPTPDGRYAIAETEFQYQPLRVFDLKPGLDGTVKNISRPIGAWTADWKDLAHNHEVRWPYVFVSSYEDGLYVFNMMDPTNPYTVGYYDTFDGGHAKGEDRPNSPYTWPIYQGAWGIDVRNADGLIVISDEMTGFWAFRMDGFDGWNGHQWGMPNVSSAQDWDNGPDGVPKAGRVS
jgi:hypothetical protein